MSEKKQYVVVQSITTQIAYVVEAVDEEDAMNVGWDNGVPLDAVVYVDAPTYERPFDAYEHDGEDFLSRDAVIRALSLRTENLV